MAAVSASTPSSSRARGRVASSGGSFLQRRHDRSRRKTSDKYSPFGRRPDPPRERLCPSQTADIGLPHRWEVTEPMARSANTGLRAAAARTAEGSRLEQIHRGVHWRRWGPYLSERQWGTVREDYSENGDAWEYFPHDHARSRAYRWGEDGIGGF